MWTSNKICVLAKEIKYRKIIITLPAISMTKIAIMIGLNTSAALHV